MRGVLVAWRSSAGDPTALADVHDQPLDRRVEPTTWPGWEADEP